MDYTSYWRGRSVSNNSTHPSKTRRTSAKVKFWIEILLEWIIYPKLLVFFKVKWKIVLQFKIPTSFTSSRAKSSKLNSNKNSIRGRIYAKTIIFPIIMRLHAATLILRNLSLQILDYTPTSFIKITRLGRFSISMISP